MINIFYQVEKDHKNVLAWHIPNNQFTILKALNSPPTPPSCF